MAIEIIRQALTRYGLESLGDEAERLFTEGRSADYVLLWIESTDEYKTRFAAIERRREAGLSYMTPTEVVEYETRARQMMREAGLPPEMYNDPVDFEDLIANDVALPEVQQRIDLANEQVLNAPPEVRAAFAEEVGVDGDGALAAMFLDEEKALPVLEERVRRAQVRGAGRIVGVEFDAATVGRLAELGVDFAGATSGALQLSQLSPLFAETASEGRDITQGEAAGAAFGFDQAAARALEARRQRRLADVSGSGGGAAGLGVAE